MRASEVQKRRMEKCNVGTQGGNQHANTAHGKFKNVEKNVFAQKVVQPLLVQALCVSSINWFIFFISEVLLNRKTFKKKCAAFPKEYCRYLRNSVCGMIIERENRRAHRNNQLRLSFQRINRSCSAKNTKSPVTNDSNGAYIFPQKQERKFIFDSRG